MIFFRVNPSDQAPYLHGSGCGSAFPHPGDDPCHSLVTFRNADEVISVTEIYGGVQASFTRSGQEINEWKRITVLFGDLVQTSEVDTEAE